MTAFVIVVVAILAVVAAGTWRRRRRRLRELFRLEHQHVGTGVRERAVANGDEGPSGLDIRPLDPGVWAEYSAFWQDVQAEFAENPSDAVGDADRLVVHVLRHRGYPVDDLEERAAEISAAYPSVVADYRAAHEVAQRNELGLVTPDDLQLAMEHYRALFEDLLVPDTSQAAPSEARSGG
jgi:hypothetical protein